MYRGAQEIQDTSQGNHIIQRLREANLAIAVPDLPRVGRDKVTVEEVKAGVLKASDDLKMKDSATENNQGQASGNSSNHNASAASPPTDTSTAAATTTTPIVPMSTRNNNHNHMTSTLSASFNPTKAI